MSTPHDLKGIIALAETKAKKIQAFIAMLRDPDLADFVATLTNGNGSMSSVSQQATVPGAPTGVREAIRGVLDSLPAQFTAAVVVQALEKSGFVFQRNGLESAKDALYRMAKVGEIKVAKEGKGGAPNVYARVKSNPLPDSSLRKVREANF